MTVYAGGGGDGGGDVGSIKFLLSAKWNCLTFPFPTNPLLPAAYCLLFLLGDLMRFKPAGTLVAI